MIVTQRFFEEGLAAFAVVLGRLKGIGRRVENGIPVFVGRGAGMAVPVVLLVDRRVWRLQYSPGDLASDSAKEIKNDETSLRIESISAGTSFSPGCAS